MAHALRVPAGAEQGGWAALFVFFPRSDSA